MDKNTDHLSRRRFLGYSALATPDHWHALVTIHACEAKKDVYVQKPLAFTVTEGFAMVKAVRDNNCVLQVGGQSQAV